MDSSGGRGASGHYVPPQEWKVGMILGKDLSSGTSVPGEQPHPLPCCPEPHPSVLGPAVWKAHRRGCHGCLGPLVCLSTHTRNIQSHIFTNIPRVLCAHSDKHTHEHSQKHIHTSTATWPHTHLYSYAHMYPQVLKSGPHTYAVIYTQDIRSFPCTDPYSQIHTFTCVIMWVLTLTNTLI